MDATVELHPVVSFCLHGNQHRTPWFCGERYIPGVEKEEDRIISIKIL